MGRRLRQARWRRINAPGRELCSLSEEDDGFRLEGEVQGTVRGRPSTLTYRVSVDRAWATRDARVELRVEGEPPRCRHLERHGREWLVDGLHAIRLQGCVDVDVAATPATNTIPIRRLGLRVGDEADLVASWVRLPTLDVEPSRQRYTRVAVDTYRYESGTFAPELRADDPGLVVAYEGVWVREPGEGEGGPAETP